MEAGDGEHTLAALSVAARRLDHFPAMQDMNADVRSELEEARRAGDISIAEYLSLLKALRDERVDLEVKGGVTGYFPVNFFDPTDLVTGASEKYDRPTSRTGSLSRTQ